MQKGIFLVGLLLITMTAPASEVIYKWVDETGQAHYSDVPRDGATEIHVKPVQTFSPPSSATNSPARAGEEAAADAAGYDYVAIASPAMEETIWNTGGLITVTVSLQPGLKLGHQIRLYLDGAQVAVLPELSSSVQLQDIPRGSHQLSAEIVDENGVTLMSSEPSTFYYHQTSVNRRPKPLTPAKPPVKPPVKPRVPTPAN